MIELVETHHRFGTDAVVTGLKTATVKIWPIELAGVPMYEVRTSRKSNGSTRYKKFPSYQEAADYALGYANRIAKEKRERMARLAA